MREDNFATYSIETAKILMASSQEVDILLRAICRHHKAKAESIGDYCALMMKEHPAIFDAEVRLVHHALVRAPYKGWTKAKPPGWWSANNEVKHARDTNFKSAGSGWRQHEQGGHLPAGGSDGQEAAAGRGACASRTRRFGRELEPRGIS